MGPFLRPHEPAAPSGRQIAYEPELVPSPMLTPRHPNFRFKSAPRLVPPA